MLNFSINKTSKGTEIKHLSNTIFFGNDSFTEKDFPSNSSRLHQVHGKEIIEARPTQAKADGHFTSEKGNALIIKTADCIPAFISTPARVFAIHAGWRGLAQKILSQAKSLIPDTDKAMLFIGPHIGYQSFQLDFVSATRLLQPHGLNSNKAIKLNLAQPSFSQTNHLFLNLQALFIREAKSLGLSNVYSVNVNTFTSPTHYSHRRNRWRIGQNYSYVVKN